MELLLVLLIVALLIGGFTVPAVAGHKNLIQLLVVVLIIVLVVKLLA